MSIDSENSSTSAAEAPATKGQCKGQGGEVREESARQEASRQAESRSRQQESRGRRDDRSAPRAPHSRRLCRLPDGGASSVSWAAKEEKRSSRLRKQVKGFHQLLPGSYAHQIVVRRALCL